MRKQIILISSLSIFLSTAFGETREINCDQNLKAPVNLDFLTSLDNIFKKNMCTSAGDIKLKSELDKNHCAAINVCAENLLSLASENEKYETEYLDQITLQEGLNRLLRQNIVQAEYNKYVKSIPTKFKQKRLTHFIEGLTKNEQSKINKCQPKTTANFCAAMTKSAAGYLVDNAFINSSTELFVNAKNLQFFHFLNQEIAAYSVSIISSLGEDGTGFNSMYRTMKNEEERVFTEESLYDETLMIENLYISIKEQMVAKPDMSDSEFTELTSKTLRVLADAHNDVIFKVSTDDLKRHLPFSKNDFMLGLNEAKKN